MESNSRLVTEQTCQKRLTKRRGKKKKSQEEDEHTKRTSTWNSFAKNNTQLILDSNSWVALFNKKWQLSGRTQAKGTFPRMTIERHKSEKYPLRNNIKTFWDKNWKPKTFCFQMFKAEEGTKRWKRKNRKLNLFCGLLIEMQQLLIVSVNGKSADFTS